MLSKSYPHARDNCSSLLSSKTLLSTAKCGIMPKVTDIQKCRQSEHWELSCTAPLSMSCGKNFKIISTSIFVEAVEIVSS